MVEILSNIFVPVYLSSPHTVVESTSLCALPKVPLTVPTCSQVCIEPSNHQYSWSRDSPSYTQSDNKLFTLPRMLCYILPPQRDDGCLILTLPVRWHPLGADILKEFDNFTRQKWNQSVSKLARH